ncbi:helix-turn-helix transcriptional regulator [Candidatus Enterococcus ferrettii]|uniref:HTH araC/xylS-type domain-containing protein n=1 Tax=Candidatus Enterococcus ferrettii TaxID=2815324 RepID=A0ABV0EK09_9ENTE|nr:AraC family transcriptional regulator [Enterococcus sp. 665A]MBO1338302.1 helix-turn-helix domain-containing protein [Enterococcus sp. 665A]
MKSNLQLFYQTGEERIAPNWHQELEMIYVVEGQLTVGIEQEVIQLLEEEMYIIHSGISHYYLASPATEYIIVKVDTRLFNEFLSIEEAVFLQHSIENSESHSKNWPKHQQWQLGQLILSLYEGEELDQPLKKLDQLTNLTQLFASLAKLPQSSQQMQKVSVQTLNNQEILERLDCVYQFIDANYLENIRIEEVAAILNVSPTYFSRFFKKNVGIPFHRFLNEYRINKAKYILSKETIPMTQVAERSGFSSEKTFHRVFKEVEGIPPLRYQKIILGKK